MKTNSNRAVAYIRFVQPWWLNREWNPEETDATDCVRCGVSMKLSPDCEWDEDPAYNICHNCAHELVEECMERLNDQTQQPRGGSATPQTH